jgi:hypothetical protein
MEEKMRKAFFVLVFTLVSAAGFAQTIILDDVYTPEGTYSVSYHIVEKQFAGKEEFDNTVKNLRNLAPGVRFEFDIKLTKAQGDIVRRVLDRYQHSRGDTYGIEIVNFLSGRGYLVVVEFTSASQYKYWTACFWQNQR